MVGLTDRELFAPATAERRAVATENIKDFADLRKSMTAASRTHAGLVFTHARRFGAMRGITSPAQVCPLTPVRAPAEAALASAQPWHVCS